MLIALLPTPRDGLQSNLHGIDANIAGEEAGLIKRGSGTLLVNGNASDAVVEAGILGGEGTLETAISGLLPDTTYYYRYAASNSYGLAIASCTASFTTTITDCMVLPAGKHRD